MKPVVIVLNGPKRTGKDTAALAIKAGKPDWIIKPVAEPLKVEVLHRHGLTADMLGLYDSDLKDTPSADFKGKTFRQALIEHGEAMKDLFGPNYWAAKWAADVSILFDLGMAAAIVPDCRFPWELEEARKLAPTLLMRVCRRGHTFDGDIGEYLYPAVFDQPQMALMNDRRIEDLRWEAFSGAFHFWKSAQR